MLDVGLTPAEKDSRPFALPAAEIAKVAKPN